MEQNARTKRKMQGQKGKCKDDTKSDSLDRCEQVERSKNLFWMNMVSFYMVQNVEGHLQPLHPHNWKINLILKLIFAGYTGSKNQVRTRKRINFDSKSIFIRVCNKLPNWHFKNQAQIDTARVSKTDIYVLEKEKMNWTIISLKNEDK